MACASSPKSFLHVDITCFLCLGFYECPVTIACGHSFCQICIEHRQDVNTGSEFICPQCGKVSNVTEFNVNTRLERLTEIVRLMNSQEIKKEYHDLQGRRLTLFCKDHQAITCHLCIKPEDPDAQPMTRADVAAQECKVKFDKLQHVLMEDRKNLTEWKNTWNHTICKCQDQKKKMQTLIQHCFKKMHQLLNEQETLLLRQLERENQAKIVQLRGKLMQFTFFRTFANERISEIEEKIQKPAHEILRDIKRIFTWKNNQFDEPESVPTELQLNYSPPGFVEMLQRYAEPMTLDPDTAYVDLIVSDDGKRIRYKQSKLFTLWKKSSTPERCNFGPAVLGTGRFASGKHYWEIEYEVGNDWEVGVCLDSMIKNHSMVTHSDAECIYQNGLWTIWTADINYPAMDLTHARIGIFLNYEVGEVTFYSVTKRTVIKSIFETFSGILRPYFEARGNNEAGGLAVCHLPQEYRGPVISYRYPPGCYPL